MTAAVFRKESHFSEASFNDYLNNRQVSNRQRIDVEFL